MVSFRGVEIPIEIEDRTRSALNRVQRDLNDLRSQIDGLQSDFAQLDDQSERLIDSFGELDQQEIAPDNTLDGLVSELNRVDSAVDDLRDNVDRQMGIDVDSSRIAETQADAEELSETLDDLNYTEQTDILSDLNVQMKELTDDTFTTFIERVSESQNEARQLVRQFAILDQQSSDIDLGLGDTSIRKGSLGTQYLDESADRISELTNQLGEIDEDELLRAKQLLDMSARRMSSEESFQSFIGSLSDRDPVTGADAINAIQSNTLQDEIARDVDQIAGRNVGTLPDADELQAVTQSLKQLDNQTLLDLRKRLSVPLDDLSDDSFLTLLDALAEVGDSDIDGVLSEVEDSLSAIAMQRDNIEDTFNAIGLDDPSEIKEVYEAFDEAADDPLVVGGGDGISQALRLVGNRDLTEITGTPEGQDGLPQEMVDELQDIMGVFTVEDVLDMDPRTLARKTTDRNTMEMDDEFLENVGRTIQQRLVEQTSKGITDPASGATGVDRDNIYDVEIESLSNSDVSNPEFLEKLRRFDNFETVGDVVRATADELSFINPAREDLIDDDEIKRAGSGMNIRDLADDPDSLVTEQMADAFGMRGATTVEDVIELPDTAMLDALDRMDRNAEPDEVRTAFKELVQRQADLTDDLDGTVLGDDAVDQEMRTLLDDLKKAASSEVRGGTRTSPNDMVNRRLRDFLLQDIDPEETENAREQIERRIRALKNLRFDMDVHDELAEVFEQADRFSEVGDMLDEMTEQDYNEIRQFLNKNIDGLKKVFGSVDEFMDAIDADRDFQDLSEMVMASALGGPAKSDRDVQAFKSNILADTLGDLDSSFTTGSGGGGRSGGTIPVTREALRVDLFDKLAQAQSETERKALRDLIGTLNEGGLGVTGSVLQTDRTQRDLVNALQTEADGLDTEVANAVSKELVQLVENEASGVSEIGDIDNRNLQRVLGRVASDQDLGPDQLSALGEATEQALDDVQKETARSVAPDLGPLLDAIDAQQDQVDVLKTLRGIQADADADLGGDLQTVMDLMDSRRESQPGLFGNTDTQRLFAAMPFGPDGDSIRGGALGNGLQTIDRFARTNIGQSIVGEDGLDPRSMRRVRDGIDGTRQALGKLIPALDITSVNLGPFNAGLQNAKKRVFELTALIGPLVGTVGGLATAFGTASVAAAGFAGVGLLGVLENMEESMAGVNSRAEAMQKLFGQIREAAIDAVQPLRNVQIGGDGRTARQFTFDVIAGGLRALNETAQLLGSIVKLRAFQDFISSVGGALAPDGRLQNQLVKISTQVLPIVENMLVGMIESIPLVVQAFSEITKQLAPDLKRFIAEIVKLLPAVVTFGTQFLEVMLMTLDAILGVVNLLNSFEIPFTDITGLEAAAAVFGTIAGLGAAFMVVVSALFSLVGPMLMVISLAGKINTLFWVLTGTTIPAFIGSLTVLSATIGTIAALIGALALDFAYFALTGETVIGELLGMEKAFEGLYRTIARLHNLISNPGLLGLEIAQQLREARDEIQAFQSDIAGLRRELERLGDTLNPFDGPLIGGPNPAGSPLFSAFTGGGAGTAGIAQGGPFAGIGQSTTSSVVVNNYGAIGPSSFTDMVRSELDKLLREQSLRSTL